MLPFISAMTLLGFNPIDLYGDALAARIAARHPANFFFNVSPTASYS